MTMSVADKLRKRMITNCVDSYEGVKVPQDTIRLRTKIYYSQVNGYDLNRPAMIVAKDRGGMEICDDRAELLSPAEIDVGMPDSVDLREPSWWEVGNQGETGSCVGWAVGDSVLRYHLVKSGKITESEKVSVRYVWMAAKETDELQAYPTTFVERAGTKILAALEVAKKFGVALERMLPFQNGYLYTDGDLETFYSSISKYKISDYQELRNDPNEWKTWLWKYGPIAARLIVDETFLNAKRTNGVLEKYRPSNDGKEAGHAVAFVGYTPDYIIIRNSWPKDEWGDTDGYGYASYEYAQIVFKEFFGVII